MCFGVPIQVQSGLGLGLCVANSHFRSRAPRADTTTDLSIDHSMTLTPDPATNRRSRNALTRPKNRLHLCMRDCYQRSRHSSTHTRLHMDKALSASPSSTCKLATPSCQTRFYLHTCTGTKVPSWDRRVLSHVRP